MGDLTKGQTFQDGGTVDAAGLHALVEAATINASFVSGNTLLVHDASDSTLKKVAYSALASALSSGVSVAAIKKAVTQSTHGFSAGNVVKRLANGSYATAKAVADSHTFGTGNVNTSTDRITIAGHNLTSGEVVLLKSSGTLPSPLVAGSRYWAKKVDSDTIELYSDSSLSSIVNLTDTGSGTHTVFYQLSKPHAVGVVSAVADSDNFTVIFAGEITGLSGLVDGERYYLSPSSAGAVTATIPSGIGEFAIPVMVATSTTTAIVLPGQAVQLVEDSVRAEHIAPEQIEVSHLTGSLQAQIQRNPNSNRQMVLAGSIASDTGLADFLSPGSGLQVTLGASASEPVILSIANGSDTEDGLNFLETITSNANFDSLTASSELFLYVDRDANGTLTYGFTDRSPAYGYIRSAQRYQSILPVMSSATNDASGVAHGVTVSASSNSVGEDPYKAFDGSVSGTNYWSSSAVAPDHWIKVALPYPKVVNMFAITAQNATNAPSTFKLQGSNDDSAWTDIKSVSAPGFSNNERKYWGTGVGGDTAITNTTAYRYYRIYVTAVTGGGTTACRIMDLSLFEAVDHFYSIPEGVMYYTSDGGQNWTAKTRVFVGEVRTSAGSVSSANIVSYQPGQCFASDHFSVSNGSITTKTHNIGLPSSLIRAELFLRENENFPWHPCNTISSAGGEVVGARVGGGGKSSSQLHDRTICTIATGSAKVMNDTMFPWGIGSTSLTSAQARVVLSRNF
jgi:hypothetical protein